MLKALDEAVNCSYKDHILIFGLDANTHKNHTPTTQGVQEFHTKFTKMGFSSCWVSPIAPLFCLFSACFLAGSACFSPDSGWVLRVV